MKKRIFLSSALMLFANTVFAQLNGLIQKNIDTTTMAYEKIITEKLPRLWIHVRSPEQEASIQKPEVSAWLGNIKLGEQKIDLRPTELVDRGPKENQLRFFFKQNKDEAQVLLKELEKVIPLLKLKDFSGQYESILEPGHYELWLTPEANLQKIP